LIITGKTINKPKNDLAMKKVTVLYLTIFTVARLYSQTYEIDFAGTGDTTVVDSVIVENLNQGISLTLKGNDVLKLNITLSGIHNNALDINTLKVYPNPMTDQAKIQFFTNKSGNVLVAVYDISGRCVIQSNMFLHPGMHTYRVTGLNQGMYIVRINEQSSFYSAKLISRNRLPGETKIEYVSSDDAISDQTHTNQLKSTTSIIEMEYKEGDRLKLTGMSGNYSTVVTGVPTGDTTITFDFMDCTDADDNHYAVVTIGTQTWMAENLATTRYNDSTAIPLVTEGNAWLMLTTPAYCWFDNDSASHKSIYGALYNWFAMDKASNSGKNVCPTGWHVPTNGEWQTLTNYIGGTRYGGKLKETGTAHWNSPNKGATNQTGFTAIAAGWRSQFGGFLNFHMYGVWWSTTEINTSNAYYREIYYDLSGIYKYDWYKESGFSVRCVKD
jgi:uncharacterized protein (TIGR02145 family)